jgi:DNA invertase Pin-like site-specific DNA recombinase
MSESTSSRPLRVGGYCRTSGESQRDNTSIPRQKEAIAARCKAEGWHLVRTYVDESVSGAKTDNRESFKHLLRDAAAGELDIVVPFDATRFARDGVDIVSTAKVLKSTYGIFTVDARGGFDNRTHRNTLRNFVEAGVAEDERLRIMERNIGGRIRKAQEGLRWNSTLPIGRHWEPELLPSGKPSKTEGTWSINDTGRKLRELLERYADGESMTKLVKEYGFPSEQLVHRWIREGQLAGDPYIVRFNCPEIGINNLDVEVPAVPEVIDATLEKRVRDRMAHNRTWNKQHLTTYRLSGFVWCGHCGHSLTGRRRSTGHRSYRHLHRVGKGGKECPFRSVSADLLESEVLGYLYRDLLDAPAFDLAVSLALPDPKARAEKEESARLAESDLERTQKKIDNLVKAIEAGVDASLLVGRQQELRGELEALSGRLKDLKAELAALPDPKVILEEAQAVRSRLRNQHVFKDWREQSCEDIQRFLHWLCGENPRREKMGIFVRHDGLGLYADVRARLWCRGPNSGSEGLRINVENVEIPFDWEGEEEEEGEDESKSEDSEPSTGRVNQERMTCRPDQVYPVIPLRAEVPLVAAARG